jgi:hypothetical protein
MLTPRSSHEKRDGTLGMKYWMHRLLGTGSDEITRQLRGCHLHAEWPRGYLIHITLKNLAGQLAIHVCPMAVNSDLFLHSRSTPRSWYSFPVKKTATNKWTFMVEKQASNQLPAASVLKRKLHTPAYPKCAPCMSVEGSGGNTGGNTPRFSETLRPLYAILTRSDSK